MSTSEYPAPRLGDPQLPRLRSAAAVRAVSREAWVVGALVLLAAVIRILTIDNQSLWMDEALTAYEAHLPFGAMIHTVATVEVTPPLYFLLAWASVHVFGPGDGAVRLVSTVSGIAIVPIAHLAARDLLSRRAGLLTAALVAVSPCLVWYSQEARSYMLVTTLTAASFLWFVRVRRDPTRRNLAWWAVCSALALMTHFFAGFVIAAEALWVLWAARSRAGTVAVAAVALVQVAMAPLALVDTTHGAGWIAASSPRIDRLGEVPLEFGLSTLYRDYSRTQGLIGATIVIAVVSALLAVGGDRRVRRGAGTAAVIAGAGILTPLLLGLVGPDFFLSRNLLAAWLPLLVVVVAACVVPRARVAGAMLGAVLLAAFAAATVDVQITPALQRPDFQGLATAIGATSVPRAIVAAGGDSADPLKIYLPGVNWVQPRVTKTLIYEVDVIGERRRQPVLPLGASSYRAANGKRLRGGARRGDAAVQRAGGRPASPAHQVRTVGAGTVQALASDATGHQPVDRAHAAVLPPRSDRAAGVLPAPRPLRAFGSAAAASIPARAPAGASRPRLRA